jgi:hypothetical protein
VLMQGGKGVGIHGESHGCKRPAFYVRRLRYARYNAVRPYAACTAATGDAVFVAAARAASTVYAVRLDERGEA